MARTTLRWAIVMARSEQFPLIIKMTITTVNVGENGKENAVSLPDETSVNIFNLLDGPSLLFFFIFMSISLYFTPRSNWKNLAAEKSRASHTSLRALQAFTLPS